MPCYEVEQQCYDGVDMCFVYCQSVMLYVILLSLSVQLIWFFCLFKKQQHVIHYLKTFLYIYDDTKTFSSCIQCIHIGTDKRGKEQNSVNEKKKRKNLLLYFALWSIFPVCVREVSNICLFIQ